MNTLIKLGKFMALPFVKFFSFTVSYLMFIGILIASSLQYENDVKFLSKLSTLYPSYFLNYTSYYKNKKLTYRFPASDMYIRDDKPSIIDYTICVWIIGIFKHIERIKTTIISIIISNFRVRPDSKRNTQNNQIRCA